MKLYEFTYCDNQKLSEKELGERIDAFLKKESEVQGWALDFKWRNAKPMELSPTGERKYFLEVNGLYLAELSEEEQGSVDIPSESFPLAAKELSP